MPTKNIYECGRCGDGAAQLRYTRTDLNLFEQVRLMDRSSHSYRCENGRGLMSVASRMDGSAGDSHREVRKCIVGAKADVSANVNDCLSQTVNADETMPANSRKRDNEEDRNERGGGIMEEEM